MEKSKTPAILITGATGNIGTELTKLLVHQKVPFRAMVREIKDAKELTDLEGVEVVSGDFNNAQSVAEALRGIERAFLLTNSSEQAETQQIAFVEAAQRAGIKHIVKLSQWAADANSPVRFLRYHAAVERKIKDSGIAYTFLRPNLFMQGLLGFKDLIVKQGKFFAAIGDAKISAVDVRDIASVAAAALTESGHERKIYNLTGAEALTHQEMAEKLSKALDRRIEFVDVPPEAMREGLKSAGFPNWQADGLIEDYAHYARGAAAEIASGVKDAIGKPLGTFDDFARDYASAFNFSSNRLTK
ncbi:MAG: SDR family oxidoreductase [Acidobacteriota bacterium]|nr:SDR family oxidoreductase [Acidobacteriota bacterium]